MPDKEVDLILACIYAETDMEQLEIIRELKKIDPSYFYCNKCEVAVKQEHCCSGG